MSAISIYQDYTPQELYDELMCMASGDADELHNALLVVVGMLRRIETRLDLLEASIELRDKKANSAAGV